MADPYADRPASRSVLLEIRRDRQVVEEGYRFLDEKRVLVAQELLRRLEAYRTRAEQAARLRREAVERLGAALEMHGLQGLGVYPPRPWTDGPLQWTPRSFLGVALAENPQLGRGPAQPPEPPPVLPSPEAERCAEAFRELVAAAAEQAVELANLHRLAAEYTRTDRRARALEDVILPEVAGSEKRVEEHLEEAEQDEAVRIRLFAKSPG